MRVRVLIALFAMLLAAACAEPGGIDLGSTAEGGRAPSCHELEEGYTVEEVHAGAPGDPGDEVRAELQQWAGSEHSDVFAGMWLDPDAGGQLIVAFSDDARSLGDEVHERFSDAIAVVEVEHSTAELAAVQQEVSEEMGEPEGPGAIVATGQRLQYNRVSVDVIGGDEDALVELSERHGSDRICLTVLEPSEPMDLDGPVRPLAKVQGWRDDLADDIASPFALVEIAYDQQGAEQAWADNVPGDLQPAHGNEGGHGLYGGLDELDIDEQALLVWSSGESGSCPGWLDEIDIADDGTVRLQRGQAGAGACTDDYNPYRMILAVDRQRLPEAAELPTTNVTGVPDGRVSAYPDDSSSRE